MQTNSIQNLLRPQTRSSVRVAEASAIRNEENQQKSEPIKKKIIKKVRTKLNQKQIKNKLTTKKSLKKCPRQLRRVKSTKNLIQIQSISEKRQKSEIKRHKNEMKQKRKRKFRKLSEPVRSQSQDRRQFVSEQKKSRKKGQNPGAKRQKMKRIKKIGSNQRRSNLPPSRQASRVIHTTQQDRYGASNLLNAINSDSSSIELIIEPPLPNRQIQESLVGMANPVHRMSLPFNRNYRRMVVTERMPRQQARSTSIYEFSQRQSPTLLINRIPRMQAPFEPQSEPQSQSEELMDYSPLFIRNPSRESSIGPVIEIIDRNTQNNLFSSNDEDKKLNHQWFLSKNKTYSSKQLTKEQLEKCDKCIICYNDFIDPNQEIKPAATKSQDADDQQLIELFCEHFYHKKCLENWLKSKPICPCCRKDFREHVNYKEWDSNYEKRIKNFNSSNMIFTILNRTPGILPSRNDSNILNPFSQPSRDVFGLNETRNYRNLRTQEEYEFQSLISIMQNQLGMRRPI